MADEQRPLILCVDDEKRVLEGLALSLRKDYRVLTATSGADALALLSAYTEIPVVISDMRMPGMDGAALLARIRELYPTTIRMLLTGEAGRDGVVSAVNEGQIFRFLTKPCSPEQLRKAVGAALEQHRLITAERVLLQETLLGCIRSLVDVLSLTNPVAYGQASRLRRQVMAFAEYLNWDSAHWQLEAAAMLSQIGYLSLPGELVAKVYDGEQLSPDELVMVGAVPEVASKLLGRIPRMEPVTEILNGLNMAPGKLSASDETVVGRATRILRLVHDFDALVSSGHEPESAVQVLASRAERYGAALIPEFLRHLGTTFSDTTVVEIPLRNARPGMVILQDIRTEQGLLLVARGFEVTERFIERMKNFGERILDDAVQMRIPRTEGEDVEAIA